MRAERVTEADRKVAGHGFGGEKSFYCELFIGWAGTLCPPAMSLAQRTMLNKELVSARAHQGQQVLKLS